MNIIISVMLIVVIFSCENNINEVKAVANWNERPVMSATDITILYSDSGFVKARIISPKLLEFEQTEDKEATSIFPNGMIVFFYDKQGILETKMSSGYAIYNKKSEIYEARNNVEVNNYLKNEIFNTEQMFWDRKKEIVYSDKFIRIKKGKDVTYGENGFTANQNFSSYTIKGGGGSYYIKEDSTTR
ncbi:LPS export ABC transporter periplasmic protein LptC [Bacteroidota bacterium]